MSWVRRESAHVVYHSWRVAVEVSGWRTPSRLPILSKEKNEKFDDQLVHLAVLRDQKELRDATHQFQQDEGGPGRLLSGEVYGSQKSS